MRKTISVCESKKYKSEVKNKCILVENMLKELNNMSRKISLIKADVDMGDEDTSKIGKLDELSVILDNAINIIAKL